MTDSVQTAMSEVERTPEQTPEAPKGDPWHAFGYLTGGVFFYGILGWLADRWMGRTTRGRISVSAIGTALIVPAVFGVGYAPTLAVAVMFLVLFGIGWGFFDGNNMPILSQIVRPELRATGYGVMNFVSISCGGLADWGFGVLRDRGVPLGVIFGGFAMVAAFSVVLVLLVRPRCDEAD